ncbi:MAG: hypothetical protein MI921_19955 [Cytophagales bacterium]|nr:hypothetical protein [Cytophagales bacterium]
MKNSKDKSIQQRLDKKLKNADFRIEMEVGEDEKIYRILYRELGNDPGYSLPTDFANSVVTRLHTKGLGRLLNPDHRPLLVGILVMLSISFGVFWLFKLKLELSTLSLSSNMVVTSILGIVSLIVIQISDQKLLKSKIFKSLK